MPTSPTFPIPAALSDLDIGRARTFRAAVTLHALQNTKEPYLIARLGSREVESFEDLEDAGFARVEYSVRERVARVSLLSVENAPFPTERPCGESPAARERRNVTPRTDEARL